MADKNASLTAATLTDGCHGNSDITNNYADNCDESSYRKTNTPEFDDVLSKQNCDVSSKLPPQKTWVFEGCLVHSTPEQEMSVMENTVIGVRHGKIIFVEPSSKLTDLMVQFHIPQDRLHKMTERQFLMPGFVDCHAHASQYSFLGTGTDMELIGWLNKYTFPAESRLKHEPDHGLELYAKCVDRTLQHGTTTISYYATIDRKSTMALVKALESRGQRAFVGKVNMDMNGPDDYVETREQSVKDTQRFVCDLLNQKNPLVQPCITPRFALSCSMDLMEDLSDIARRYHLSVQTHLSENVKEIHAVTQQFPECPSYTHIYDKAGLLGCRTMLAHAVHISGQELDLIRERDSGICHCPNSNFSLTSGVMDLRNVMNSGVKVGLGTDFGAGNSPSMLDAMRRGLDAAKLHQFDRLHNHQLQNGNNSLGDAETGSSNSNHRQLRSQSGQTLQPQQSQQQQQPVDDETIGCQHKDPEPFTYKHLFRLATLGSSQVMGLDDVIGNFEVGKDFDAILVDVNACGTPIDVFSSDSREDVVQKFIFLGDDRNITRVFVQGRQVIDRSNNVC